MDDPHDLGADWDDGPDSAEIVTCFRCKHRFELSETFSLKLRGDVCMDCAQEEITDLLVRIGTLWDAVRMARSALEIAHRDLAEWRQFARYNAQGILYGEFIGLPDPPQRPTIAGLNVTEQIIEMIEEILRGLPSASGD